jgi:hypothetical protein
MEHPAAKQGFACPIQAVGIGQGEQCLDGARMDHRVDVVRAAMWLSEASR